MTETRNTATFGIEFEIFILAICFINIYIFTLMSYQAITQILFHRQKQQVLKKLRIYKPMLISTTVAWITIILRGVFQILLLTDLFFPFFDSCISNTCLQCTITRKINNNLRTIYFAAKIWTFSTAIELSFKRLEESQRRFLRKVKSMKIWIIILAMAIISYDSRTSKYEIMGLSNNSSIHVCKASSHLLSNKLSIGLFLTVAGTITRIWIIVWFLYKSIRLLRKSIPEICTSESSRDLSKRRISKIMDSIIRHTVVSVFSFICPLFLILPMIFIRPDIELMPIVNLFDGILLMMLFSFGRYKYNVVFGKLHGLILNRWLKAQSISLTILDAESTATSRSTVPHTLKDLSNSQIPAHFIKKLSLTNIPEMSDHSVIDIERSITPLSRPNIAESYITYPRFGQTFVSPVHGIFLTNFFPISAQSVGVSMSYLTEEFEQ